MPQEKINNTVITGLMLSFLTSPFSVQATDTTEESGSFPSSVFKALSLYPNEDEKSAQMRAYREMRDDDLFQTLPGPGADQVRRHARTADPKSTLYGLRRDGVGRLSRIVAMQQQAMTQAAALLSLVEGQRIQAALGRIESGECGFFLVCNEEISEGRLVSIPVC